MILLSAQNISKTYMERKVLDNVSFFLNEGDKVGIIGINGTGKSTLLRILAGAEESDSGNVIRTSGVRISYLPQIPEFAPHGSVLEQVMLHLPADLKEAKEFEAKSILGKLGITGVSRDIGTLSGGERRRAGIAAALIQPAMCCCWTSRPTTSTTKPYNCWKSSCKSIVAQLSWSPTTGIS
ncbi:MAG: ATP-binding cassette domain-containing protein [Ruminococcus sp.]